MFNLPVLVLVLALLVLTILWTAKCTVRRRFQLSFYTKLEHVARM